MEIRNERCEPRYSDDAARQPFVHCFRTRENHYIYDVNSNQIVKVQPGFWHAAKHQTGAHPLPGEPSASPSEEASGTWLWDVIEHARAQDGLFLPDRPPGKPHETRVADVQGNYQHGLTQLMLTVTLQCNMRCTYCLCSDQYPQYPSYADEVMTWDTAQTALDYFIAHTPSADAGRPGDTERNWVSFYGGEPLLEFGLIQRCVAYAEEKAPGRFGYHITTNGTLLDTEVADFLAQHNVEIEVSVDGPAFVHDARRKLADGGGSLHTILENLRYIRDTYPAYYGTLVMWSMVHDPQNTSAVAEFLAANDLTPPRVLVSWQLAIDGLESCDGVPPVDDTDVARRYSRLLDIARVKKLKAFTPSETVASGLWRVRRTLRRVYRRSLARPRSAKDWLHAGPCLPGVQRLYVAPDGALYPCHMTPHRARFAIGTVDDGIDLSAACTLMNDLYKLTSSQCAECWAVRLCSTCPGIMEADGWTDERAREAACTNERSFLHEALVLLCEILERNPSALD